MLGYAAQLDNELATVDPANFFGCAPQRPLTNPATVLAFEQSLATNGLPQFLVDGLSSAGITDPNDLAMINGFLYVQDPSLVADGYNAVFGPKASRPFYWQSLADDVP